MSSSEAKVHLVIVAAGTGSRMGADVPKQYIEFEGKTILEHSLHAFRDIDLSQICIVCAPEFMDQVRAIASRVYAHDMLVFVRGGNTRKDSVYNGISLLVNVNDKDIVLVHDAARPFVCTDAVNDLIDTVKSKGAATLGAPASDTMRYADENHVLNQTASRDHLWMVQTPQGFPYAQIMAAHEQFKDDHSHTDDTGLITAMGEDIYVVPSSKMNFKITTKEDLELAEKIFAYEAMMPRVGMGFDVHAFDENENDVKSVRLCGVDVAYDRKLKGHSDADVGLHALTDAILGAIGEGDIGLHFPPSNMDFKNMDSAVFLNHALKLMQDKGGVLVNADVTLICERPKIGAYRDEIVLRLADLLKISKERVNIKATTTEKLGFTGRKEGIAAQACVSIMMP